MKRIGLYVIFLLVPILLLNSCNSYNHATETNTLRWIPEESYYIGYDIIDDIVKFQYSICFENCTEYDTIISLHAKFHKNDLKGWVIPDGFFVGCDENANTLYQLINAHQKINVVYTFFGEYVGGDVSDEVSFPDEIIIMTDIPEDEGGEVQGDGLREP